MKGNQDLMRPTGKDCVNSVTEFLRPTCGKNLQPKSATGDDGGCIPPVLAI